MLLLKILVLQSFWFVAVLFGNQPYSFLLWFLALAILVLNYSLYKIDLNRTRYCALAIVFSLWGFIQDSILELSNTVDFIHNTFWLNSLWLVFLAYYGDVLTKFTKLNFMVQGLIGGLAGVLTFWSGFNIGNIAIHNSTMFICIIFTSWFFFFPLTLNLFYKKNIWNWFLDKSIYYSFDNSGFERHAELFKQNNFKDLKNKKVLVTGGTRGIGYSTSQGLIALGAEVLFTGRSILASEQKNSANSTFYKLDMTDWKEIEEFTNQCSEFDGVVVNAGGMPALKETNAQGIESQAASQLFGHYYLLDCLRRKKKLSSGCRVTWVSSGGMYLKKLDLNNLVLPNNYDKVDVYANVKRAQVTMVEEMAKDQKWDDFIITAMHPGWVATKSVKTAIPGFYNFTKSRLRTPEQGADTIVWLQSSQDPIESGAFYFDRKIRSPYISKKYIPSKLDRIELINMVQSYIVNQKGASNV